MFDNWNGKFLYNWLDRKGVRYEVIKELNYKQFKVFICVYHEEDHGYFSYACFIRHGAITTTLNHLYPEIFEEMQKLPCLKKLYNFVQENGIQYEESSVQYD